MTDETKISEGFTVGFDVGQQRDFSAISVLERLRYVSESMVQHGFEPPRLVPSERTVFHVRHLQRLKLGVSYPEQIRTVATLLKALPPMKEPPALVVDATGCGRPVIDAMREARLQPIAITITSGHAETRVSRFDYHVPKRTLVTNLAVLLQDGNLQVAAGLGEGETLVSELLGFKVKITASGNETYGAWRESVHDDLVLSCAIAAYWSRRRPAPLRVIPGSAYMGR